MDMSRKALSQSVNLTALSVQHSFDLRPDDEARAEMAKHLGLLALKKLTFKGEITPEGPRDARLTARLGATVVQPCGVTLQPVSTRIEEDVTRLYLANLPESEPAEEAEMPEDVEVEAMPQSLDLALVMEEALSLALPMFPRAPDAGSADVSVTEPGKAVMTDEDAKPFAGLAGLRDTMNNNDT